MAIVLVYKYTTVTTYLVRGSTAYFLVGVHLHFHFLIKYGLCKHAKVQVGPTLLMISFDWIVISYTKMSLATSCSCACFREASQPTPKGPAPFIRSHRLGALLASLDDCRLDRHASLIPELERLGIDLAGAMARFDQ